MTCVPSSACRREQRSSPTATADRAPRSPRRSSARSATTRATTKARGTNGRATTTCRSSRPLGGLRDERSAEARAELLPGGEPRVQLDAELLGRDGRPVVPEPAQDVVAADLRMELHRPGRPGKPERLRYRAACQLGCSSGERDREFVGVERLEPLRQDAEHGIARALRRQLGGEEAAERPSGRAHDAAHGVCERLRAEADAEEWRLVGDPGAQRVVLLVEPWVLDLLADVLVAAEDHHGVDVARRPPLTGDVPGQELVPVGLEHVAEELGPRVVAVYHGEDAHQAVGTPSCSSSFRRSCAPAGACATPCVWLLLLKNAYASSERFESSRRGGTHSRSSFSS